MQTKNMYLKMFSIILAFALFCSACSTQGTGRQSLSATGTAVLTPPGVETESPAGIEGEDIEDQKPEKTTQKDKDGTVWDISKEVTVEKDGYTFHAYLSKDGKKSWIYQADPGSDRNSTLSFPEEVQGAELTKLGKTPEEDSFWDIFGNGVEPYHKADAWGEGFDPDKKYIKKIFCPPAVKNVTAAAFCGFRNLEEIVLPQKLKKIPLFLLFYCKNLRKIVLPQNPDLTKAHAWLTKCNRIKEVELPEGSNEFCIKKGMLLSKDKKTLYQVFVTGDTVTVPEGVTRIVTRGINASDITKIRSICLPSTLSRLDADAIQDKDDWVDLGRQIRSVTVARNNPVFAQAGNCLYERATETLAVFVGTKKSMTLPEEIRYISDSLIQVGGTIKKLIIPERFKGFKMTRQPEERILRVEEFVEFCSVKPPEIIGRKKKRVPTLGILIVPKKSKKVYKEWYHVGRKDEKLIIKTKEDKAYIASEYDRNIMENHNLIEPEF